MRARRQRSLSILVHYKKRKIINKICTLRNNEVSIDAAKPDKVLQIKLLQIIYEEKV
jgi:hypothetical protein